MSVVSVTRFRLRERGDLPLFIIHVQRCLVQIRRADGYLTGALRHDGSLAYWTATVWRDERALLACMTSGAHRAATPKFFDWGDEASTVRWSQDRADLPDWPAAVERMREEGWAVPLRDPGPGHAGGQYDDVDPVHTSRI